MPRFTVPPNFTGTAGSDTIVGEDLNKFPAIGIDILTGGFIYTGSGKDTIKGNGTGGKGGDGAIGKNFNGSKGGAGIGISNNGNLNAGSGDDAIIGKGIGGRGGNDGNPPPFPYDDFGGNGGGGGGGINIDLGTGNDYFKINNTCNIHIDIPRIPPSC
ncbi:MAG: hypothetical protein KME55_07185 [Nostoc indistinguendum CM1-VF10]|jgi:hypothetical protein|nr:hypothetical protein [Nostoc indistinguendum CM1-VF10]